MKKAIGRLLVGLSLVLVGLLFIPRLVEKLTNRIYRKKKEEENIDFDNMGPEIVKRSENREDEEREG